MLIADNHYTAKNIRNFEVSVFELIISVQSENRLLSVLSLSAKTATDYLHIFIYRVSFFFLFLFLYTPSFLLSFTNREHRLTGAVFSVSRRDIL